MSTAPAAHDRFVIAGWRLEEERHCIERDGTSVKLEPRATALLAFMARHAGEPLARADLVETVWQGTVVGDEVLTTAINKIRKAFGDSRQRPRVIETIPKTGYRLIAPVARQPAAAVDRSSRAPVRRKTGFALSMAAVLAALGLLTGILLWLGQARDPAPGYRQAGVVARPTVAVQPFEVLGNDPEQLYLARGLTTDLIGRLSELSGLTVRAAPGPGAGPDDRGDGALEERYEVWGAVRRDADRLQVEVRLVEHGSGRLLWVQRYERPFGDLFDVQQDIGTRLARTLSVQVDDVERDRMARRYTRSVAAYDLFLRAQSELLVRRKEDNVRARDLYLQAVDLDPTFARAYAGLALIHAADYRNQWSDDGEASLNDAVRFAGTALEIDPLLPEAHWAMAYVRVQQREHAAALSELDEALRLQNGFADALALKGGIKTYVGEPRATLDLLRRAIRINPEAGYLYFMTLGRAYYYLGDSVQAVINLREAAARNPSVLEVRAYLAAALLDKGDRADAEWEVAEILAIRPDFSARAWLRTYPMTDTRQQMQLTAALGELGL